MGLLSSLLDIFENTRKTTTKVESSKPSKRNYDFDSGFTGSKKLDCPVYKPSKANKKTTEKDKER